MTDREQCPLARRHVLQGTALAGVAAPFLAACSGGGGTAGAGPAGSGGPLTTTGAVPEGSGTVLDERQVVVTQPQPGTFKGFSAICTHQGCTVSEVTDTINCPCHGSRYSIVDGSVVRGPAEKALPPVPLDVNGKKISRA